MKNPKIRWPSWGVLWLAVVLGVTAFPALATSSKASKTVLVYETIGQPPSYPLSFKAYTSSLGYTPDSGLSFNLSAAQEQNITASGIVQAPVIPALDGSGNPLSQSALLSSANASFAQYAQPLASQLASYMSSAGAGSAIFNFQQQVMVQGNSHPMYLTWQEIVDSSGRPRYGNAQLIPTQPNFVYAHYTSKAVAAALPPSFAYPQAGMIQWQQVEPPQVALQPNQSIQTNQQLTAVTGLQPINVNGAFDAPAAVSTATTYPAGCTANATGQVGCDPDYGLKCLINHASDPYTPASPNPANPSDTGCPAVPINGYTDFITMENANGASGGYVDYVRTLTPVYTTSTDANGDTILTAAVTVSVDTRTWHGSGYSNCPFTSSLYGNRTSPSLSLHVNCIDAAGNNVLFQAIDAGDNNLWVGEIFSGGYEVSPVLTGFGSATVTILSANLVGKSLYQAGWNIWNGTADVSISGGTSGNSGGTYTNTGHIGYAVQSTVNRYYVTPDGNYYLIGNVSNNTTTTPQYYGPKTVSLPNGASAAGYAYIIIDPFNTTQTYDYRNDTVNQLPAANYIYVAPIVTN